MSSLALPNPLFKTDASRWAALQSRNPLAASSFVYCVTSTKICCRPTCKARLARRSNVIFHNSYADAAAAGFRSCKRCRPELLGGYDPQADAIARACRAIEDAEGMGGAGGTAENGAKLSELSTKAGLTKSHFHRMFKRVTGVTPRIYAVNLRAEKLLDESLPAVGTPVLELARTSVGGSDGLLTPDAFCVSGDGILPRDLMTANFHATESFNAKGEECTDSVSTGLMTFTNEDLNSTKKIEYTIQPWASGFVLIAATNAAICWLEAGHSVAELCLSLAHEFPLADLEISDWSINPGARENQSVKHGMFAAVMEALVRPTGKLVDIPFDIS